MLTDVERKFVEEAKHFLEKEALLISITNSIGKPLDSIMKKLPPGNERRIASAVDLALRKSLDIAIRSTPGSGGHSFAESLAKSNLHRHAHTGVTTVSGAVEGFFGLAGAIVELPVSTTLIMRNIVSIAKDFNFNPSTPDVALECLYVLTMGSKKQSDDQMDSAYYTARLGFLMAMNNATSIFKGVGMVVGPQVARFLSLVGKQFGVSVTQKMMAEALPVIGAFSGAGINALFTDYFGRAARFHFGMLELEKRYGSENVQKIYNGIALD